MLLGQQRACSFSCQLEGEGLLVGKVEQPVYVSSHNRKISLPNDAWPGVPWDVLPQAGVVTQQLLLVMRERQQRKQKQLASCWLGAVTVHGGEAGLLTRPFPPPTGNVQSRGRADLLLQRVSAWGSVSAQGPFCALAQVH
jgi:hypothetical protein